jgi:beta-N-acetylhexosaminidase
MKRAGILFRILMLAALLLPLVGPAQAQGSPERQARELLRLMTPEERVGQLFLVTFQGTDVGPESPIYALIEKYHVGGVVLLAKNDNFVAAPDTIPQAHALIAELQNIEWNSSTQPNPDLNLPHTYVPLLIGLSQEGDGYPNDQIITGLTELPSQMAIGATWNPALAEQSGQVMGRELSALGVNLYMGLSLDVVTTPTSSISSELSTRVFGGDPYWAGQLGRAFMQGMQAGANGRMAIAASHFPGRGESDRSPEQEVSTVRKSLEELKQIELAPFFTATAGLPGSSGITDALLVSHIRYQGFQGNIRATTRPVSLDQQSLGLILGLPELAAWRQGGGIMISDDLGTQALRRFYDPGNTSFAARLVARDAFLAGNDLLYMGNIVSSDAIDTFTSVARSMEFFAQKYNEDPAFSQRVDESVLRILTLKLRLYGTLSENQVKTSTDGLLALDNARELLFSVARQSATLISPSVSDLASVLPDPPAPQQYITIFTDTRTGKQCSTCPEFPLIAADALQASIVRLYGPNTGGLVTPTRVKSFSFDDLSAYLDGQTEQIPATLEGQLRSSNWIVFATLDLSEGQPQTTILRRFLSEKQNLLSNKRIILFSFSAPYYLDATDISKLTAYYGLYSKSAASVEMAARLLFQELNPLGSLPVSLPSVGYDLITATSPNPDQVISLSLDLPAPPTEPAATLTPSTAEATPPAPIFRVGDTISVRTGLIVDHNLRQVPDGTVVRFSMAQGESGFSQQVETVTSQGVARASFRLDQPGLVEIRAVSEPATVSDVIQLPVSNEGATIIIITPTEEETETPEPTPSPTATPEPAPRDNLTDSGYPTLSGWALVLVVIFAVMSVTYWIGAEFAGQLWGLRGALVSLFGGLAAYNYLMLDMPGAASWLEGRGLPAFIQAIIFGQALGALAVWVWKLTSQRNEKTEQEH